MPLQDEFPIMSNAEQMLQGRALSLCEQATRRARKSPCRVGTQVRGRIPVYTQW